MRRPKTTAAVEFKRNAHALREAVSHYGRNRAVFRPVKDLYLGGVISKLYAEFENYVSDSIAENLATINSRHIELAKLPREFRSSLIHCRINHDHFRNYYASQNEERFLENIDSQFDQKIFSWNGSMHYSVTNREIVRTQGYPSEDNLVAVYKRLGIRNIFSELNRELSRDTAALLRSVNSVRCGFVHDAQNPEMGVGDFKRTINDMIVLVMAIDHVVSSLVVRIR